MQSAGLRGFAARAVRGVQRQQQRRMGAGPPGGYFAEGVQGEGHVNGRLFNETPPPLGQSRKWEDWEAPWYATMAAVGAMLVFGLSAKPETSGSEWAREEAKRRLAASGK